MTEINEIIKSFKNLYSLKGDIKFDTPQYVSFEEQLTDYIYRNHFEDTPEWNIIKGNLVYKSTQWLTRSEADKILIQLNNIKEMALKLENEMPWNCIHPKIIAVSKKLFQEKHYSNSVEDAFKEIASRVRKLTLIIKPDYKLPASDASLMTSVFSVDLPIIKVNQTNDITGHNIQLGVMQMLAGAMSALRNPKAHSNDEKISKEECIRQLMFASMLMYKIDDAVAYSKIDE